MLIDQTSILNESQNLERCSFIVLHIFCNEIVDTAQGSAGRAAAPHTKNNATHTEPEMQSHLYSISEVACSAWLA